VRLERVIGVVFAIIGAVMLLLVTIDLIAGPGKLIQYGG
jgi:hypothetical protein